jgi:SAM-dependent methyltransferase
VFWPGHRTRREFTARPTGYARSVPRQNPGPDRAYTQRLEEISNTWWKRVIDVQAPYRWHIRRLVEGDVLDIGCGIGRNLVHLGGRGVGVDTNPHSVEAARRRGLTVFTVEDFADSESALVGGYGTLLLAHVLEHMTLAEAEALVSHFLPYRKSDGAIIFIVPQEAGFLSDPTHVSFVDAPQIDHIAESNGLKVEQIYSFPLPRRAGKVFRYNETVALLR